MAVVLAGCGAPSAAPSPAPVASTGPAAVAVAADPARGHVHTLLLDGAALLVGGNDDGLWRPAGGEAAQVVSRPPFDVIGLTRSGGQLLASGRRGEGQDGPSDLGLVASDGGLVVVLAGESLVESADGGATFTTRITGVPAHRRSDPARRRAR